MNERPTAAADLLARSVAHLSHVATQTLYRQQPELEALGPPARDRVLEDFGHHFRALASLDAGLFAAHVAYCYGLFERRGFPRRWLDDAWAVMREVLAGELDGGVAGPALSVLDDALSSFLSR